MPAEPAGAAVPEGSSAGPGPGALQPFVMMGDDGALCVDGVCAVPADRLGATAPSVPATPGA